MSSIHRHYRHRQRRGIAATEAAVTLPVIVLLVFSMLQISHVIFLRQRLTAACYVGAQQMAQRGTTEEQVLDSVKLLLESRGIQGATVSISPEGTLGKSVFHQVFTLQITAPVNANLPSPRLIPMSGAIEVKNAIYQ